MADTSGESEKQQVEKGHRITRVVPVGGPGHESRGQKIAGSAKAAPAPESVPPMSALPPTARETQQMSQNSTAPTDSAASQKE
jgi:hypothetical protein